jgi:hypothetical protein
METKIAKIISVLFQPLLMPTYTLLLIFSLNSYISMMVPSHAKNVLMWIVFLSTFVFPVIFIFILYKRGLIKTLNMDDKEERTFPLLVTSIFYFLMYYIVWQSNLDEIYNLLFMGSALLIVLALIISFFWKISMHMIGVGGMLGALIGLSQAAYVDLAYYVVLVTLVCGLVGFARLKLKAHTPAQVYAGFSAGFLLMLFLFLV